MFLLNILKKINIFRQCAEYNLRLSQCPSFLFVLIGVINMAATASTYLITTYFTQNPEPIIIITVSVTLIIFVVGYSITKGFERLAQANKMKTEFVSIASHQLRTPLSSIRWIIELMTSNRLGKLTPKQLDYVSDIQEGNERMIRLVNDLLDVTRIEMGRLNLQPKPIDIIKIVEAIAKDFTPMAKARNIKIELKSEKNLPQVLADPQRVPLAIQNLIDNAVKYIKKKGQVKISILNPIKNFVKISISDTGVGIPRDQKKFIFQRFFRSDNILKHQTTGTGLGLFIARAIAEASGGKMGFESQENVGSTFWLTLPVAKTKSQPKT